MSVINEYNHLNVTDKMNSEKSQYYFLELDNAYLVAPSKWIKDKVCVLPTFHNSNQLRAWVLLELDPEDEWEKFNIVDYRGPFGWYYDIMLMKKVPPLLSPCFSNDRHYS